MGFRLRAGLTSHHFGLDPDLATIGKAIGSGIAVAAVVGTSVVMDAYRDAKGLRGGTFSGNPVACAAIEATLPQLDAMDYPALRERGDALRQFIEQTFDDRGMPLKTTGYGNVFAVWFASEAPADYEAAHRAIDPEKSLALHIELRRRGVLVMPSPYGRSYTTFAHDEETFGIMRAAFSSAARAMSAGNAAKSLRGDT